MSGYSLLGSKEARQITQNEAKISTMPYSKCSPLTSANKRYTEEEVEFMNAMDMYKRSTGRKFPTWSEALTVIRELGWKKS